MDDFNKIVLGNLETLDKKGQIFIYDIEDRVNDSLNFLKTKYSNISDLNLAIEFIEYHHSDAIKGDIEQMYRVGHYPSTEVEMELDHSIKHALIGSYKAAFSDLRRAIELTLISVFLLSEHSDRKKAVEWFLSKCDTPNFSKSLNKLIQQGHFKDLNNKYEWKKNLQHFYWQLSDYSHNKGKLKGYRELNKTNFFTAGTSIPTINYETLESICDFYIKTVGEIIVMLALYNPMILVGVPLDEKFGLNPPISGFFYEEQAKLVHKLIPNKYKSFFSDLTDNDVEISSIIEYFNSLPDLTKEEIDEQSRIMKNFY